MVQGPEGHNEIVKLAAGLEQYSRREGFEPLSGFADRIARLFLRNEPVPLEGSVGRLVLQIAREYKEAGNAEQAARILGFVEAVRTQLQKVTPPEPPKVRKGPAAVVQAQPAAVPGKGGTTKKGVQIIPLPPGAEKGKNGNGGRKNGHGTRADTKAPGHETMAVTPEEIVSEAPTGMVESVRTDVNKNYVRRVLEKFRDLHGKMPLETLRAKTAESLRSHIKKNPQGVIVLAETLRKKPFDPVFLLLSEILYAVAGEEGCPQEIKSAVVALSLKIQITESLPLDKYEVSGELGAGGMGVVLEGRRKIHGKVVGRVAIKVLPPSIQTEERDVEGAKREAQTLATIKGTHIVPMYDAGLLGNGGPYMVMEFIEGGFDGEAFEAMIQRSIENGRPVPIDAKILVSYCLTLGVQEAHQQGYVHRDLKPANFFITPKAKEVFEKWEKGELDDQSLIDKLHALKDAGNPLVLLTDFGVATKFDATQAPVDLSGEVMPLQTEAGGKAEFTFGEGVQVGTPGYMSPETALGKPYQEKADLYALGVTIAELLKGKFPYRFTAHNRIGMLLEIARLGSEESTVEALVPLDDAEILAVLPAGDLQDALCPLLANLTNTHDPEARGSIEDVVKTLEALVTVSSPTGREAAHQTKKAERAAQRERAARFREADAEANTRFVKTLSGVLAVVVLLAVLGYFMFKRPEAHIAYGAKMASLKKDLEDARKTPTIAKLEAILARAKKELEEEERPEGYKPDPERGEPLGEDLHAALAGVESDVEKMETEAKDADESKKSFNIKFEQLKKKIEKYLDHLIKKRFLEDEIIKTKNPERKSQLQNTLRLNERELEECTPNFEEAQKIATAAKSENKLKELEDVFLTETEKLSVALDLPHKAIPENWLQQKTGIHEEIQKIALLDITSFKEKLTEMKERALKDSRILYLLLALKFHIVENPPILIDKDYKGKVLAIKSVLLEVIAQIMKQEKRSDLLPGTINMMQRSLWVEIELGIKRMESLLKNNNYHDFAENFIAHIKNIIALEQSKKYGKTLPLNGTVKIDEKDNITLEDYSARTFNDLGKFLQIVSSSLPVEVKNNLLSSLKANFSPEIVEVFTPALLH